jgi:hypothetical protein
MYITTSYPKYYSFYFWDEKTNLNKTNNILKIRIPNVVIKNILYVRINKLYV